MIDKPEIRPVPIDLSQGSSHLNVDFSPAIVGIPDFSRQLLSVLGIEDRSMQVSLICAMSRVYQGLSFPVEVMYRDRRTQSVGNLEVNVRRALAKEELEMLGSVNEQFALVDRSNWVPTEAEITLPSTVGNSGDITPAKRRKFILAQ